MRLRRAALIPASLTLLATALTLTGIASAAPGFTVPPLPSTYARNVDLGGSATTFTGDSVLDPGGTSHFVWVTKSASGGQDITSCTFPRGAKGCSASNTLTPPDAADNTYVGSPQVILDSPNNLEIFATTCCSGADPTVIRWTSADNGTSWALDPAPSLTTTAIDDSILTGDQLVVVGAKADGTVLEQIRSAAGASAPVAIGTSGDPEIGPRVATTSAGDILVVSDSAPAGDPEVATVTRQAALGGGAFGPATALPSYSGEEPLSLAAGPGGPWLLTRQTTSGVLDPPVLLRHWNGSSFDAPKTLSVPGQGDDKNFNLVIDGSGRLQVVWTGAREDYRLWHATSSNGGKSWSYSLLDDNVNAAGFYPVLDAYGIGTAVEIPAGGTGSIVVQPLLVVPTFSVKASRTVKKGLTTAVVVSGKVGSPDPGKLIGSVQIQKLIGKHWSTVATQKLAKGGTFKVSLKPGKPGTSSQYRAYTNGVAGYYDNGTSNPVTVKFPALKQ